MRNFDVFYDETFCNLIFSCNISYFLGIRYEDMGSGLELSVLKTGIFTRRLRSRIT